MPVVTFQARDLCALIGRDVPVATLAQRMPMMGGDLDSVEGDAITIEWFPDRPDLLTPEGTARALRAFLDIAPGMPAYDVAKAKTGLRVDPSVSAVRPHAALCFVRGVAITEAYLLALIDAQEKLTLAPGRRRRKIAIGIHDAAGLEGPFTYTCMGPGDNPFRPLGGERAMTPAEILAEHPKGQEYGHLLPKDRYPVFLDGAGEVLSLPPVINAHKTTVTPQTRDLLIDVTGTDAASVRRTIALLATGFADRGGRIEAVTVHDASGTWTSPDLTPLEQVLDVEEVVRLLGVPMDADHIAACLRRMGHHAEPYGNKVLAHGPAWRFDLLHAVDWMEDIAIGHGFEGFPGVLPAHVTLGGSLPHQDLEDRLRLLMVGHGFHEVRTLTLSDAAAQWGKWGAQPESAVVVANPVLEDRTLLRTRLLPSLLEVLARNRHRSLPQRVFEIGDVVRREQGGAGEAAQTKEGVAAQAKKGGAAQTKKDGGRSAKEARKGTAGAQGKAATAAGVGTHGAAGGAHQTPTGAYRNRLRLATAEQGAKAGFADARGLAEAVLRDAGVPATLRAADIPGFIPGRAGEIVHEGGVVGHFGEIHPDTVVAFGLAAATVALELDLSRIVELRAA